MGPALKWSSVLTPTHRRRLGTTSTSCLAEEYHPGGQDEGAGDGGRGLDEDGNVSRGWRVGTQTKD